MKKFYLTTYEGDFHLWEEDEGAARKIGTTGAIEKDSLVFHISNSKEELLAMGEVKMQERILVAAQQFALKNFIKGDHLTTLADAWLAGFRKCNEIYLYTEEDIKEILLYRSSSDDPLESVKLYARIAAFGKYKCLINTHLVHHDHAPGGFEQCIDLDDDNKVKILGLV